MRLEFYPDSSEKLYINVVIFMYRNERAKQVRKFVNHCV